MGSLTLPRSGSVYLDANAFIYSVERIEPYFSLLKPMWEAAQASRFEILSSELVILETLVKPLRDEDQVLEKLFRELLHSREVRLVPVTAALWERAARLRATTGLKTPDALHGATALGAVTDLFITNDPHFLRIPALPLVVLSELITIEDHEESEENTNG